MLRSLKGVQQPWDRFPVLGRALFVIASCLSELERNLIVECSAEGQRRAKARGKHVGRPTKQVDERRIFELRDAGQSLRSIAAEVGVSTTVVSRVLASQKSPLPEPSAGSIDAELAKAVLV